MPAPSTRMSTSPTSSTRSARRRSSSIAPQTLEHEAEHVVEDMGRRLAQQGLDLETYYKMRNTDAAKFLEEEAKPVAHETAGAFPDTG